jgi:hypothetical protein
MTPLAYLDGVRSTVAGFTSQAVLTGSVGLLRKKKSGTIFTKDTGTSAPNPNGVVVGQVLKIVGGTGDFSGATGTIAVAGQEVGALAVYTGELCTP